MQDFNLAHGRATLPKEVQITRDERTDTMTAYNLTDEQNKCLTAFATGENMTIQAGAGTGKTSTLRALAESTDKSGLFIAFNKSVKLDAERSFPGNVKCRTAHSLAYKGMYKAGKGWFKNRLSGPRVTSKKAAELLGITDMQIEGGDEPIVLRDWEIASAAMGTVKRFCYSADDAITTDHVPYQKGREHAHDTIAQAVLPYAQAAWSDLNNPKGKLKFTHDHYVKIWALTNPVLDGSYLVKKGEAGYDSAIDFIMLDEAQDTNPVIAAVFKAQRAQKIVVGDSQQAIYEWRGARDALAAFPAPHNLYLTQSFRFGPAVADKANVFLSLLKSPLVLKGTPTINSKVEPVLDPTAIICRTNATVVQTAMDAQQRGLKVAIVGGTREIEDFAKAARELMEGRKDVYHADLAAFGCWPQVQAYVATDEGADLRVMVKLIDNYGVDAVLNVCEQSHADEATADLIVTTAHKSKGREWDRVRIAADFTPDSESEDDPDPAASELRLFYVAVTRAINALDASALDWCADLLVTAAANMTQEEAIA